MGRRKSKTSLQVARDQARTQLTYREPIIRVHDRRNRFVDRMAQYTVKRRRDLRMTYDAVYAPKRFERKRRESQLLSLYGPRVYEVIHNCKRGWSRLLSWRASRAGGSARKRTARELRNNKSNFNKRDC